MFYNMPFLKFLFFLTLFAAGCQQSGNEESVQSNKSVFGKWKLISAERNGTSTGSLENTFFEFKENGVMVSNFNLNGVSEEKKYEMAPNAIIQHGSPLLEYKVKNISSRSMLLETNFSGTNFILYLERSQQ